MGTQDTLGVVAKSWRLTNEKGGKEEKPDTLMGKVLLDGHLSS